jgi:hypothetical protein
MTECLDRYLRGRAEAWESAVEIVSDMVSAGNTPEDIRAVMQAIAASAAESLKGQVAE